MKARHLLLPLCIAAFCPLSFAQPPLASSGYRLPSNTIIVAPGQVTMVSISGAATRLTSPVFPPTDPVTGWFPTLVSGFTMEFVQGLVTVAMPIRGVQQAACPPSGACSPMTSFTVQIPYELSADSRDAAILRIRENAGLLSEIPIKPVTDNIHVINNCDQTGIFLSIAFGLAATDCAPVVMHARGPLIGPNSPAVPGETLILWAYGLGALDRPLPVRMTTVASVPLAVQPFTLSFSYIDGTQFPFQRLGVAVPPYVGMSGAGLYQVHVVVPETPPNLPRCGTLARGNVRILLSGPVSSDFADICMTPRTN